MHLPTSAQNNSLFGQIHDFVTTLGPPSPRLSPSLKWFILLSVVSYDDSSMDCMSGRLLSRSGGLGRSISGIHFSIISKIISVKGPDINLAFFAIIILKKDCVRYPLSFSNDLQLMLAMLIIQILEK
mgnify:CR=1 FL=1